MRATMLDVFSLRCRGFLRYAMPSADAMIFATIFSPRFGASRHTASCRVLLMPLFIALRYASRRFDASAAAGTSPCCAMRVAYVCRRRKALRLREPPAPYASQSLSDAAC